MRPGQSTPSNVTMAELPDDVIDEVERIARLARRAVDDNERAAYVERRDGLLEEHGFRARIRREDHRDVLVCYPADWVDDGTVYLDDIDDTSRAVERPLDGTGNPEDWDALDTENREVVRDVVESAGPVHGANAEAFADFMSNHYAKPVAEATRGEVEEFLTEYFPRNVWPTEDQRAVVRESLAYVFAAVDVDPPLDLSAPVDP